jgi:hypothetical protein
MYCTVDELKTYLSITTSGDDTLLATLVNAAHQRINDDTRRNFEATADTVRYYDAVEDTDGPYLYVDDVSYISGITSGGSTVPATEYVTYPRNSTPWNEIKIKSGSTYYWNYVDNTEDSIVVTGRHAVMHSKPIASISRSGANVVTATLTDTSGLGVGAKVYCVGIADIGFNGGFTLTAVTDTTVTWAQIASSATSTTGTLLFTPASIRQACTRLAAFLYRQKDTQGGAQEQPILAGDGSVIMPTTLPRDVQILLQPWIKIR